MYEHVCTRLCVCMRYVCSARAVININHVPQERLVFIGTCSVTTTLVSAFTKSDNRTKVKFSFDLLEPHIGSLLLAFLCLT